MTTPMNEPRRAAGAPNPKASAAAWFEELRDWLCDAFERIEDD